MKLIVIALLLLGGYWLFSVCQHALEKHGQDAILVDRCLQQKNPMGIWQRKSDGHLAFPCQLDYGRWGIKFDQCTGENCTAFIKEKLKKLDDFLRYLHNRGFEPYDESAKLLESSVGK